MKKILNVWPLAILVLLFVLAAAFGADGTLPPAPVDVSQGTQGGPSASGNPGLGSSPLTLPSPTGGEGNNALLDGVIGALTAKYGWIVAALSWMSICRFVFKTAMTQIEKVIRESESKEDDRLLEEVEHSRAYVFFCWVLDLLTSIKIGPQLKVLVFGLLAVGATGCAVFDKAATGVTRANVTTVTNTVVVTNLLPIAVSVPTPVPGETIFKTNFVDRVFTNTVIEARTNFVLRSEIAEGLQTAQAGAAVAGVFNPGAGALATTGLGIVGAALGLLAARKNKQAGEATRQLHAVVHGVEEFTSEIDEDKGNELKGVIEKVSKVAGVKEQLDATVQSLTKS